MPAPAHLLLMAAGGGPSGPIVTDSFDRANDSLSLGNADTGQAWTAHTGTWGIISNTAYQSANNGTVGSRHAQATIDSGTVAADISLDIATGQTGTSVTAGIIFRYDDALNFYRLIVQRDASSNLGWFLSQKLAGVFGTIDSGSVAALTGTLRVVDDGNGMFDVYVHGSHVSNVTGWTSLNTFTRQGIIVGYTSLSGANTGTGWRFDNYSVT